MFTFVVQITLLLVVLGGAIAYIGNYVGRYIGKRRLTLFNLRPRYTATAITIISGILIAISTMAVLLIISQDARTALLGLDRLKKEISEKSKELNTANESLQKLNRTLKELEGKLDVTKEEAAQLQKAKQRLSREITVTRQGEVLFKKDEVITLSLIQAGPEKEKIEEGLSRILSAADTNLRGLGIKSDKTLVTVAPEEFNQTVYELLGNTKIFVVKLMADHNSLWGEEIPAHFELVENRLVYRTGEEIAGGDIPAGISASQIEQEIMGILKLSHQSAREAGVLPEAVGSIPYSQIIDFAKKIKATNKKVGLKVLAKKDIYVIGPLEVELKISYK